MKKMKLKPVVPAILLAALLPMLHSCLDNDDNYYIVYNAPNAIVTVKPIDNGSFYMQLDDSTTLLPVNMKKSPYGDKELRALVSCYEVNNPDKTYSKAVHVNWIDSILTKPTVANQGTLNDSLYGNDPVEIIKDWITIAEDGYLTLRFRTKWSGNGITHHVNLLTDVNPENPYEVQFRHDAHGDICGIWGDGLVAFRLSDLPDTNGKTVKLKLTWNSYDGEKSTEFNYCTRKSTPSPINIAETKSDIVLQ